MQENGGQGKLSNYAYRYVRNVMTPRPFMGAAAVILLFLATVKLFEIGRAVSYTDAVESRMLTFLGQEAGRMRSEAAIARIEARDE